MKYLILITSVLSVILPACKKQDTGIMIGLGEAIFMINGKAINPALSRAANNTGNAEQFDITLDMKDDAGICPLASLYLFKIPKIKGRYTLKATNTNVNDGQVGANYFTTTDCGDVLEEVYIVDESAADNYVDVLSYDKQSGKVSGKFNITLIIDPQLGATNPLSPGTIRVTGGEFYLKID